MDPSLNTVNESQEENALIECIVSGESSKFEILVRNYQQRIHRTMFAMLGNRHDAEDATQETFLTAFRKLSQFERRASFYTWLHRIAFNLAIDRQRQKGRKSHRCVGDEMIDQTDSSERENENPLERAITIETVDQVRVALERLDAERRNIIVLRDIDGLDYTEIAAVLDLPIGTVRSRLHRARLELREIMVSIGMQPDCELDSKGTKSNQVAMTTKPERSVP